jgi:hypothetical protein
MSGVCEVKCRAGEILWRASNGNLDKLEMDCAS